MSQPHVEPSLSYTPNIGQVVWSASAPPSDPAKDKPLLIMIKRMNDKTNSTKLTYKPKQNSSQSTCSADSTASKKKICSTELISRLTSAATFPLISWWKSMACVRVADSFEPEGSAISEISQMRMKKNPKHLHLLQETLDKKRALVFVDAQPESQELTSPICLPILGKS